MNAPNSSSLFTASLTLAAACFFASAAPAQTLSDSRLNLAGVIQVGGVSQPTCMAFIGPDDILIGEKGTGRIMRVISGAVQPSPVLDLPVNFDSERGLLGLTIHPNFATNNYVYVYYSRASSDGAAWIENRLARYVWNGSSLTSATTLLNFPFDATQNNGPNHDGGPIVFGPDNKLYGITGDLNRGNFEQNATNSSNLSGVGGVYRLNFDGSIPSDNPFFSQSATELKRLFAYGVRNSFGLAFDPATGNLWDTENGPSEYDEINLVPSGFNSGWWQIMGPDSRDPQNVSNLFFIPNAAYSDPEYSFATPVAVTSICFPYNSDLPPDLRVQCFVGDNNNGNLYMYPLNAARTAFTLTGGNADLVADSTTERNAYRIGQSFGVITDLEVGPDGSLYLLSLSHGDVYRISFCGADINGDDTVDVDDLTSVILNWGTSNAAADINDDGTVNIDDLTSIILNWGACL